ncbi:MAG: alpha/beta hydrolase-fold protein [Pirellulales bacterium]|nr:alpha/beta hydrolase-fold protein [Pirellulales bacterium]
MAKDQSTTAGQTPNNSGSNDSGKWTEVDVAGHPCQVYEPPIRSPHEYVVLYMHDRYQGTPAARPRIMEHFARHGLRIIAPLVKQSWWADRICADFDDQITAEQYLLTKMLPFVEQRWQCKPPQLALLGASMGGQGALRLAYKYPNTFPVVAAFFPAIDFQICIEEADAGLSQMYRDAEDARQDTATLHIHPLNWPRHQWFCCDPMDSRWYNSADRLRMKLDALGVPHECDLETSAGGHTWDYVEHMAQQAIDFLIDGLEQERLRVGNPT